MKQLMTRWGQAGPPALNEYPRPCMERRNWTNLNGSWDCTFTAASARPEHYDRKILVPFSPESALSGVNRQLMPDEALWYRTVLPPVDMPKEGRLLLHFGAVDQSCTVYIGGRCVGSHQGGYLPFTIDITVAVSDFLHHGRYTDLPSCTGPALSAGETEIVVRVTDPSDTSWHSRGKQKLHRGGMFYTAQSGIWQTVWLEAVPANYIQSIRFTPDYSNACIRIIAVTARPAAMQLKLPDPYGSISLTSNEEAVIPLPGFHPWSPEDPFLYYVTLTTETDEVQSYFAMRSCEKRTSRDGLSRIFLNGRPCFQAGVLDQGYWPDGLYTAPGDEAMTADILSMKELGFNMLRKHIKLEPQRWYYHCDRLGMLVWQDMVCGGSTYKHWFVTYLATLFNALGLTIHDGAFSRFLLSRRDNDGLSEFLREAEETVTALWNHPSVICYVPFNEGWGQFDALQTCEFLRSLDPGRLIDHASGWFDQGGGDFKSLHYYFFRLTFKTESSRALALTEFGGYSMAVEGHTCTDRSYGYGTFKTPDNLTDAYEKLIRDTILPAVRKGICTTIYTQLSDVEDEVNGFYTYDRKVLKMDPERIRLLNRLLKEAGGL